MVETDGAAALVGRIVLDRLTTHFVEVMGVDGEVLHVVGFLSRKAWDTSVSNVVPVSRSRELQMRVTAANQRSSGWSRRAN